MNIFALFSLFAGVLSIYLGNFVYHLDKKKLLNKIFMFFSLSLSYWAFTEFMYRQANNPDTAYLWIKIGSLWPFALGFFFHFALVFTEKKKILENKLTYFLIYVPAAIFSIIELTTNLITAGPAKKFWGYTYAIQEYSWVFWISQIWIFGLGFLALFLCVGYYFKSTNKNKKKQAKYVSIGFSIPLFAGLLTEGLVPLLQLEVPALSVTFSTGLGIFLGYAIWKYELFTLSPATAAENIISTMPDSLILTDPEGKILTVNQSLLNLLGYKEEELIEKSVDTLFAEERFRSEILRKLLKDGVLKNYETKWKTKAGEEIQVSFSGSVVRSKEGQNVGIVSVIRDITEPKQMEEKLRQYSENLEEQVRKRTDALLELDTRYAILVEEAIEGVVIVQDQEIVFPNKKFMEMVGYPINELVGLSLEQFVEKLVDKKYRKLLSEIYTRKNGEDKVQPTYEFELTSRNGEHIPVEITATVVCFENRNEMLILLRDIRERKQAEEQRLNLERLAAIGEIASMVGHDLRNPLSGIAGATYYLKKKLNTETPSKTREMLDIIEKNIEYSDRIVNDLLDYSKQIRLSRREVAPKSIIQESVLLARVPKNIEVSDLTQNEPKINIDSDMMKRVFINIIKNAADAMPNGGKLTMKSKESGDNVEIAFSDNGVGIPKEIVEKLFTPLFTTKAKGMGLGLAICKRIVEAHGGHIRVESTVNEGTTFTVIVPITREVDGGEKNWMNKSESLSPTMMKA